jgi:hypothetical protein
MMLSIFILATIYFSFVRGQMRETLSETVLIEPSFLSVILLYGFFDHQFDASFGEFILWWIMPVFVICFAAYGIGRTIAK